MRTERSQAGPLPECVERLDRCGFSRISGLHVGGVGMEQYESVDRPGHAGDHFSNQPRSEVVAAQGFCDKHHGDDEKPIEWRVVELALDGVVDVVFFE